MLHCLQGEDGGEGSEASSDTAEAAEGGCAGERGAGGAGWLGAGGSSAGAGWDDASSSRVAGSGGRRAVRGSCTRGGGRGRCTRGGSGSGGRGGRRSGRAGRGRGSRTAFRGDISVGAHAGLDGAGDAASQGGGDAGKRIWDLGFQSRGEGLRGLVLSNQIIVGLGTGTGGDDGRLLADQVSDVGRDVAGKALNDGDELRGIGEGQDVLGGDDGQARVDSIDNGVRASLDRGDITARVALDSSV